MCAAHRASYEWRCGDVCCEEAARKPYNVVIPAFGGALRGGWQFAELP
jgi:hypothetical protein